MMITQQQVNQINDWIDGGLCSGLGQEGKRGNMCAEAVISYVIDGKFNDKPTCVSPAVTRFMIKLNDLNWSSKKARAKGLRLASIAQLGSAGVVNDREFAEHVAVLAVSKYLPKALRYAASLHPDQKHKDKLESQAVACELVDDLSTAAAAANAAYAAYAASYAANFANSATNAAAAANFAYAAAAANADSDAKDKFLTDVANDFVEAMKLFKSPGVAFLEAA